MLVPVRVTADVELREYRPARWVQLGIAALTLGILAGVFARLFVNFGPYGAYEYRLWRWEADTLVGTLFRAAGVDGDGHGKLSDDETLQLYYGYTSQIRGELNTTTPDDALVEALTGERAVYAKDVERIITGRIDDAITEAGLQESLPFFNDVDLTWPPVSFKVTRPPQLLVISPRDEIARKSEALLRTGLTATQIDELEADADSKDQVSIVVSIGGLAAYPAFVRDDRTYGSTVETASHEWVHHYLAFYPLGQTWGQSATATILNETTANIAGRALAAIINNANPVAFDAGADGGLPNATAATVDFNAEMRKLRLAVDDLLAQGKVEEAEALMEQTRLYLADHGIIIRKINQAYFAFYGSYGDSAASSDPIGPKVERVWELTGDVGTFLKTMREITSVADLDETIATLERVTGN